MALRSTNAATDLGDAANADKPARKRRTRTASKPRPAFFILQVVDENGQPTQFDKSRIKIVAVERDAEKVLDLTESGAHPHAFYLRGMVPVSRQAQTRADAGSKEPTAA